MQSRSPAKGMQSQIGTDAVVSPPAAHTPVGQANSIVSSIPKNVTNFFKAVAPSFKFLTSCNYNISTSKYNCTFLQ